MKAYYNDITNDNLKLIKSLKVREGGREDDRGATSRGSGGVVVVVNTLSLQVLLLLLLLLLLLRLLLWNLFNTVVLMVRPLG